MIIYISFPKKPHQITFPLLFWQQLEKKEDTNWGTGGVPKNQHSTSNITYLQTNKSRNQKEKFEEEEEAPHQIPQYYHFIQYISSSVTSLPQSIMTKEQPMNSSYHEPRHRLSRQRSGEKKCLHKPQDQSKNKHQKPHKYVDPDPIHRWQSNLQHHYRHAW